MPQVQKKPLKSMIYAIKFDLGGSMISCERIVMQAADGHKSATRTLRLAEDGTNIAAAMQTIIELGGRQRSGRRD